LKHGLNFIKESLWKTGVGCNPADYHTRLHLFVNAMTEDSMIHPMYRVTSFTVVAPFTLQIVFDDGKEQVVDFDSVLEGDLYGPLRDEEMFKQVEIDPEVHTLVWPNGADFDPYILHDWPGQMQYMKKLAMSWKTDKVET